MQIGALIPPGLTPENAAAHMAGFDRVEHVRAIAGQGFKTIELGGDMVLFFPGSFAAATIDGLAKARRELGLTTPSFETVFDPNGLEGRGLYIGVKPL
jgi:hypothetical protein